MPVVYKIQNTFNGKIYIGSAISEKQRKRRHFSDLRANKHHSVYLQRAFNKYSEKCFIFSILENIKNTKELITREQYWIDKLKPEYNLSPTAGNCLGVKHTKDFSIKNSIRNSGFGNGNCKLSKEIFEEIIQQLNDKTCVELAKKYNVHRSSISRLFKRFSINKTKTYNKESRDKLRKIGSKNLVNRSKKVVQYDKEWKELKIFDSLTEASKETGFSLCTILNSCKGYHKSNINNNRKCFFKYL